MVAAAGTVLVALAVIAQSGWTAAAGRETFSYRDVARNGPPADASPVEWTGSGPSLTAAYERATETRAHRVLVDIASAGSFVYAGPVRRTPASSGDGALRLEGRYEYRRYLFASHLPRGLDMPCGVQGMLRRLSLDRRGVGGHMESDVTSSAATGVLGVRVRRWPRWSAELDWTNGLALLREHDRYDVAPSEEIRHWGGSWLTDLAVAGTLRVLPRVAVTASWLHTGEGSATSHHTYVFSRDRVVAGVTYAR